MPLAKYLYFWNEVLITPKSLITKELRHHLAKLVSGPSLVVFFISKYKSFFFIYGAAKKKYYHTKLNEIA